MCIVNELYIGSEQLVRNCIVRPLHVAYRGQPRLLATATPVQLIILTLLFKVSATFTDYRVHRRTLFYLTGIISLFIMGVGM